MNSAAAWERTAVTVKGTECWQLGNKRQSALISGPGSTNPSSSCGGPGDIIVPSRHKADHQQGVSQVLSHICVIPSFQAYNPFSSGAWSDFHLCVRSLLTFLVSSVIFSVVPMDFPGEILQGEPLWKWTGDSFFLCPLGWQ